ncbi:translationally-controlled tumor protein homolog [Sycon ciliatum]|uniref:translationally-controlled tumor protein homolog n=1 Tax=Sycon ciliatum TaxID=27933 RepID=UPI0020ABE78F|eukprot:scpid35947/ scgid23132/ Translationally-controlled tumor protein homolog
MKIFRDVISGDELFSDTFPMKLVDDLYYEVEGKTVTESSELDDSLFGGNASAEGADEGAGADGTVASTGINVVMSHRLSETVFTKKSYQLHIKEYMKAIKAHLATETPARVDTFVKGMPAVIKKFLGQFDNFQFFNGESMNPDGMAILMNYREDGITPFFVFFKDGLVEEKC